MSGLVAVGADAAATWAPEAPALVVVPVDAGSPAAVPASCPHAIAAVRADAGSVVAAVRAHAPDEVLVDAAALGDLAAPVLVALREVGIRCGVRAEGAPEQLDAMLEVDPDRRGMRALRAPSATAGAGAIPAPLDRAAAADREIARLEAEVDALAARNGELESAVRGLGGVAATARIVVKTVSPRTAKAAMGAIRRGQSLAAAADPRRLRP